MARADISLGTPNSSARGSQFLPLVIDPAGNIYNFIQSGVDNNLYWQASYDGGFTWTVKTLIKSLSPGIASLWYDRWTPGVTTDIVHLTYADNTNDDVSYRQFNLATETLNTEVTVFNGASIASVDNDCMTITKAIGGNLYIGFDVDGGTETGFYYSTDGGASWSVRSNVNEAANTDYYILVPGFAADTNDIMCMFWDRSASEISRKIYDVSADSWSETSIAGSMTAISNTTCAPQFSVTVDDANNKIDLVAWSNRDALNADLRFWEIDESSITENTNVVLNSVDDQQMCALCLDINTATLYCFYGGKSDGSETAGTSINIYYKTSTDRGVTWGSETKISNFSRNYDFLYTCPVISDSLGKFFAVYELQVSTMDEMLISCVLPSSGGNTVSAPIFGGLVVG